MYYEKFNNNNKKSRNKSGPLWSSKMKFLGEKTPTTRRGWRTVHYLQVVDTHLEQAAKYRKSLHILTIFLYPWKRLAFSVPKYLFFLNNLQPISLKVHFYTAYTFSHWGSHIEESKQHFCFLNFSSELNAECLEKIFQDLVPLCIL